jgi:hypothetical protein
MKAAGTLLDSTDKPFNFGHMFMGGTTVKSCSTKARVAAKHLKLPVGMNSGDAESARPIELDDRKKRLAESSSKRISHQIDRGKLKLPRNRDKKRNLVHIHEINTERDIPMARENVRRDRDRRGNHVVPSTTNCFAFQRMDVGPKNVLGSKNVRSTNGTIRNEVVFHDPQEIFGRRIANHALKLTSEKSLGVITSGVVRTFIGYSDHESHALLSRRRRAGSVKVVEPGRRLMEALFTPIRLLDDKCSLLGAVITDPEVRRGIRERQDVGNPIRVVPHLAGVTRHATNHVGDSPSCIATDTHAARGGVDVAEKVLVTKNVHCRLIVEQHPRLGKRTVNMGKLKGILHGKILNPLQK